MALGNAAEFAATMEKRQGGFAGRDFSRFKGVAPSSQGSRIVYPSRDTIKIWENCFLCACQYIGYRDRHNLYRLGAISAKADAISKTMFTQLFIKYYQDGDHEMVLRVSLNLTTAFQVLRNSRGSFKPMDIINTAFGITVGDAGVIDE